MKNTYKKKDSKGNELPINIGKGVNVEHAAKVKKSRKRTELFTMLLSVNERDSLQSKALKHDISMAEFIRIKCEL